MPRPDALFASPSLRGPLARGVLVGGAAAVGWALARRYGRDDDQRMLDWDHATRVAIRVSGGDRPLPAEERARLQDQYETMMREIEGPISS